MNLLQTAVFGLSLAACVSFAAESAAPEKFTLKDTKDKVSYSIGLNIGEGMKKQGIEINPEALVQGIKDVLGDGKHLLTEDEMSQVMMAFQKELMQKAETKKKTSGDSNKKEGVAFLEANKKKEGVKTLASGLQYIVLKEGAGKSPKATDTVVTHYRGTLIDGKEFDSSYKRNEPATFPVNQVIKGWTEALQLMKEGSKWQLFVPSELGYGEDGAGNDIGPNSVLIFEVELISILADKPAEK
jgi:FKBP-type peptidyl-prolyl cis-trans isomerase FklB